MQVSKSHTIRHTQTHILGRTPLNEWSARRRGCYLYNPQPTQDTNFHALSGIQTRDPSNPATSDQWLWSHCHCNRL